MLPSKNIIDYIRISFKNYDRNIKNISDIVNNLREIRRINDGENVWLDDIFGGFGFFLNSLTETDLRTFIHVNIRHVFYYAQIVDRINESDFKLKNNTTCISISNAKSILACAILCIMPTKMMGVTHNVNLHQLYTGISLGSKTHVQLLWSILKFFSDDPLKVQESEQLSLLVVSTLTRDSSPPPLSIPDSSQSWPLVLFSRSSILSESFIPNCPILCPMYLPRLLPSSLLSSSHLGLDLPLFSSLPVLLPLLPLLLASPTPRNMCAVDVRWEDLHYTIQDLHFLSPWDRRVQYSRHCVLHNIDLSLSALSLSLRPQVDLPSIEESSFAHSFTKSVLDDVIQKLHFTSSQTEPVLLHQGARTSLPSGTLPPYNPRGSREGSISSNILPGRSSRHSYSTSSSSRNGSLQLSSLSSRRSSSNTPSSTSSSANNTRECDPGTMASAGDKVDFSIHTFQPIIVEESGNHIDDDDSSLVPGLPSFQDASPSCPKSPLAKLLSASVSDSTKMSLSKEVLIHQVQLGTMESGMRRRNSTPTFRQICEDDDTDESQLMFEEKELYNRCCEEDANNDHLVRVNNRARRQSLPCHLRWLYQLPLTDSTKLNLSHSHSILDTNNHTDLQGGNMFEELSDNFLDGQVFGNSKATLANLVSFVDNFLNDICLDENQKDQQKTLRLDILEKRKVFEESSVLDVSFSVNMDEEMIFSADEHSLHSRDLATFDRVLNSSTFFDNEALHIFSKFSTMSSSSSTWTPREHFHVGGAVESSAIETKYKMCHIHGDVSTEKSIVDYVNQLTTSIISDVMDHDFGPARMTSSSSREKTLFTMADKLSVEVIASSLSGLCDHDKKYFGHFSPICIRAFPFEYDRQLSLLIEMLAAVMHQQETGQTHLMIFDQVTADMDEIFQLLAQEKKKCNPEKMFKAILTILNDTGTISISNLISYLMHNY